MNVATKHKHQCEYWLDCFQAPDVERGLMIFWDTDSISEDMMWWVLDDLYGSWADLDEYPDAEYYCLEEWILLRLTETGLEFDYEYLGGEEEDAV